jgi:hypothetical protein
MARQAPCCISRNVASFRFITVHSAETAMRQTLATCRLIGRFASQIMMPTVMPDARRAWGVMAGLFYLYKAIQFIGAGDGAAPMAGLGGSI